MHQHSSGLQPIPGSQIRRVLIQLRPGDIYPGFGCWFEILAGVASFDWLVHSFQFLIIKLLIISGFRFSCYWSPMGPYIAVWSHRRKTALEKPATGPTGSWYLVPDPCSLSCNRKVALVKVKKPATGLLINWFLVPGTWFFIPGSLSLIPG